LWKCPKQMLSARQGRVSNSAMTSRDKIDVLGLLRQ
jgi:hypothetical protein